jgi:hypothetical protein
VSWTVEQVVALAPDASAARAGRSLADARRWSGLGTGGTAAWGECRGSAAQPYRACIDLAEPAFRCSCPSRKLPCKHALGLFLILAGEPGAIGRTEPPDWVRDWLEKRADRAVRAARPAEPPADPAAAAEEQARRARRRQDRVDAGVDELSLWLGDLVRQGIADLPGRPRQVWTQLAARMADAQAPGLARLVGEMSVVPYSGPGWPDRLLARMGRLHLALEGWRRMDSLPEGLRAELRALVGFTESREAVIAGGERSEGRWAVVGRSVRQEERLRVQRTWLRGLDAGRHALLLDFAAVQQPLDVSLVPGSTVTATLAFYPAALPLRAVVAARRGEAAALDSLPGVLSVDASLGAFAAALAANPWLERAPMSVRGVVPSPAGGGWSVVDGDGASLPLASDRAGVLLLALGGGHPIDVFGEWDGLALTPLAAWAGGAYSSLEVRA